MQWLQQIYQPLPAVHPKKKNSQKSKNKGLKTKLQQCRHHRGTTVAFHSIHHGALCVTGLMNFQFCHLLKLLLHMGGKKIWPEKGIFWSHILAVLSI